MSAWGARWGGRWGNRWGAVAAALAARRPVGGGMGGGRKRHEEPYGITVAEYLEELRKLKAAVDKRKAPTKEAVTAVRDELDEVDEPTHVQPIDMGQFYTMLGRIDAAIQLREERSKKQALWDEFRSQLDQSITAFEGVMREEEEMMVLLLASQHAA